MEKSNFYCPSKFNPALRKKIEVIDTILALILVALSIISLLSYNFFKGQITDQVLLYGGIGLFFSTAFLEFVPNFLNPYLVLLAAIPILGIFSSLFFVIIGSLFGSILGFELGRKFSNTILCPLFDDKTLRKIFLFWTKYGKWFVSLAAVTPLPYFPIVFGALGMSRRDFLVYGVLVRTASFILVGYGAYIGFSLF